MTERAWDADDVSEDRRVGAKLVEATAGRVKLSELLEALRRNGPDPAILEAGLGLCPAQYARLKEAFKRTPVNRPKNRRRRR